MKKFLVTAVSIAIAGAALVMAPAAAAAPTSNPVRLCAALAEQDPEAYAFLATKPGGCVSSVASVGVEALMAGAFPSKAAAVGNCKFLEANVFGGYPYAFYGQVADPRFVANNRAGCIAVLKRLHTGEISPPEFPGGA